MHGQRFIEPQPFERRHKRYGFAVECYCAVSAGLFDEERKQILGQLDQVFIISVGIVEFEHGEFRIMFRRHTFVAEIAVYFKHAIHSADDKSLQIKLGCDPQVERHIESIMVCLERLGSRTAGNRMHHRRLDLDKFKRFEKCAYRIDKRSPLYKDLLDRLVDDQIDIPPPVPYLDVF